MLPLRVAPRPGDLCPASLWGLKHKGACRLLVIISVLLSLALR